MTPREIAWVIVAEQAKTLRGSTFRFLLYLLDRALSTNSLIVRVGRRRAMKETGLCRDAFNTARSGICSVARVSAGENGRAVEYDLRVLWDTALRKAGLEPSPVYTGLNPSPVATAGPETSPVYAGLNPSPVPDRPGLNPSPVGFPQPGLNPSPVPDRPGLNPSPVGFPQPGLNPSPVADKPGLNPSPVSSKNGMDLDRSKIDRSIDPFPRAPNAEEIATAHDWLRTLRYQNGEDVKASEETCVYALQAAGSLDRLRWALSKLDTRLKTNRAWRPKHPQSFRPWIRKAVADELAKLDRENPAPVAPERPAEYRPEDRMSESEHATAREEITRLAGLKRLK